MASQTLRRETAGLIRLAGRDLDALWRLVATGAAAEVAMRDLLPSIVTTYGSAGATMASDWYDDLRLKADAKGRFLSEPIKPTDRGTQSLIGWALQEAADDEALKVLIAGGVQRRIADHIRGTVTGSSVADPAAQGWQRTGIGECNFCSMLIGRGAVYTEATADFASHDHCRCSATVAWKGKPLPVKAYTPTERNVSDADRARVREYIAGHPNA